MHRYIRFKSGKTNLGILPQYSGYFCGGGRDSNLEVVLRWLICVSNVVFLNVCGGYMGITDFWNNSMSCIIYDMISMLFCMHVILQ